MTGASRARARSSDVTWNSIEKLGEIGSSGRVRVYERVDTSRYYS
jgi:hypothetical protein